MRKYQLNYDKKDLTKLQGSLVKINYKGLSLYFSYETLVGVNEYVTKTKYSITTSKQVNKHLGAKLKENTYLSVDEATLVKLAENYEQINHELKYISVLNYRLNCDLNEKEYTKKVKI